MVRVLRLRGCLLMKILSGTSHPGLAEEISQILRIPLTHATITRFADEEVFVEIHESIRGEDVFVLQSTCFPTNDNLMELLVILDALKRGSAGRITACIPYFGYARQDRKSGPRTPISAKLVADLLTVAGVNRVLALDLHTGQIQGFFDVPVDNLYVTPFFAKHIQETFQDQKVLIVSPDVGGVVRARSLAKRINAELAIIDKRRERPGESEVMHVIGDVAGRLAILIDDIVDSAGTLCQAAEALIVHGVAEVHGYATHGVLSSRSFERIRNSSLKKLTVTNSIPLKNSESAEKIQILSIAPLLAEAIRRTHHELSISCLFD